MERSAATNEALTEEQILQMIAGLPADREGVARGVALLGLDNLREAIETPLHLPPGQRARSISSEHDDRRLHVEVAVASGGERTVFHDLLIDKRRGYQPLPQPVVFLLGKLSYCVARERTIDLPGN